MTHTRVTLVALMLSFSAPSWAQQAAPAPTSAASETPAAGNDAAANDAAANDAAVNDTAASADAAAENSTAAENDTAPTEADAPSEVADSKEEAAEQNQDEETAESPAADSTEQKETEAAKEPPPEKDGFHEFSLLPLPIIASNPASGWMFGLAPTASWLMGKSATTRRSSLVSSGIYTTRAQLLFLIKFNVFLKDDDWNIQGDWRYFDTSQPTYGAGTGPSSSKLATTGIEYEDGAYSQGVAESQMMEFKYLRFHQTVLKRIAKTYFYAGLGYHLDYHFAIKDQLLDLTATPPALTSHYAYSASRGLSGEEYLLSGVSLNGLYDSRDNQINPYSGRYGRISLQGNPKFLGSSAGSGLLWLEYRDYFGLQKSKPRHLIAVWAFGSFALGDRVPYLDLPALGWDFFGRSGRAFPQGRFRGKELLYTEVEYRFPIPGLKDRLGGVVFANATTASNPDANVHLFRYVAPAGGLGGRFMFNKKSRSNLTLDYAWGMYGAHGFYLNANETF